MNLTNEEKDLLESYEKGEWVSVKNLTTEKKRFKEYAQATLRKAKRVNIRISERDLNELQRKAVQ